MNGTTDAEVPEFPNPVKEDVDGDTPAPSEIALSEVEARSGKLDTPAKSSMLDVQSNVSASDQVSRTALFEMSPNPSVAPSEASACDEVRSPNASAPSSPSLRPSSLNGGASRMTIHRESISGSHDRVELDHLSMELASSQANEAKAVARAEALEKELEDAKRALAAKDDAVSLAHKQRASSEEEFRSKVKGLEEECKALRLASADGAGHAEKYEEQISALKASVASLEEEKKSLSRRVEELSAENGVLSADIETVKSRAVKEREANLEKMRQHVNNMKTQFQELSAKQKAAFMKVHQRMKQEEAEKRSLTETNRELTQKLQMARQKMEQAKKVFTEKEKEVSKSRQMTLKLEKKFDKERRKMSQTLSKETKVAAEKEVELENVRKELEETARVLEEKRLQEELKKKMQAYIEYQADAVCNGVELRVRVVYKGELSIQWSRSFSGSEFNDIVEASGDKYTLTADDVGAVVRATITAKETGLTTTADLGPIDMDATMETEVEGYIDQAWKHKKDIEFVVMPYPKPKVLKNPKIILLNKEKLKIREGSKTKTKREFNENMKLTLDSQDPLKFSLQVDDKNISFTYCAKSHGERDKIAFAVRSFIATALPPKEDSYLKYLVRSQNLRVMKMQDQNMMEFDSAPASVGMTRDISFISATADSIGSNNGSHATGHPSRQNSIDTTATSGTNGTGDGTDNETSVVDTEQKSRPASKKNDDGEYGSSNLAAEIDWSSDEEEEKQKVQIKIKSADEAVKKADGSRLRASFNLGRPSLGARVRARRQSEVASTLKKKKKQSQSMSVPAPQERERSNSVGGTASGAPLALDVVMEAGDDNESKKDEDETKPSGSDGVTTPTRKRGHETHPSMSIVVDSPEEEEEESASQPASPTDKPSPRSNALSSMDKVVGALASPKTESKYRYEASLVETIHVRTVNGSVSDYAVYGEVDLRVTPTPTEKCVAFFRIDNLDRVGMLKPNKAFVRSPSPGVYAVKFDPSTPTVCALKYKVNTKVSQAKGELPLLVKLNWLLKEKSTSVDVSVERNSEYGAGQLYENTKFLLSLGPEGTVTGCKEAKPNCMWSQAHQKLMWKFASLDEQVFGHTNGLLHATLSTTEESQPSPVTVAFRISSPQRMVSGVEVHDADDALPDDTPKASMAKLSRYIKSGSYTAQ